MMLVPRRKGNFDLFDEMFNDPFFTRNENKLMKTDIKEKGDKYLVEIDLPGYEKDDIKIEVEDGYLTVHASVNKSEAENKEDGKYIQKERYSGECARSFYIGEDIKQEDIKASFKNGMLTLTFPKIKQKKNEKKYIDIE